MTPLARVRVAGTAAGTPDDRDGGPSRRYEEDRAAITAMLKNYGLLSLAWLVPAALLMGVIRIIYLSVARRFEEALDVVAAWWWNVAHFPGTVSRRRRVQKARRVGDRSLRRFMESAGVRSPRWFATAERILEEQRAIDEADEGEPIQRRLRDRTASLVGTHPVIVGTLLAIVVGAVAVRELVALDVLAGGALPAFPARAGDLIGELASAVRSTPLGGPLAPSPAVGALGALSFVAFGDPSTVQKAILLAGPAAGRDPDVPGGRPSVGAARPGGRRRSGLRARCPDALVVLRGHGSACRSRSPCCRRPRSAWRRRSPGKNLPATGNGSSRDGGDARRRDRRLPGVHPRDRDARRACACASARRACGDSS